MTTLRKVLTSAALAATVIGGTAALTATPASARVVCDRWHCWHTYDPYYYGPGYYPSYYGPGVSIGFGWGGGWHGGYHGGYYHGGGYHGGGYHHH